MALKFASEIRVRDPNLAFKNVGDKYSKLCLLNFRYDPKICVVDLMGSVFSCIDRIISQFLPIVVPELPKFFLLFCDLTPNVATKLEARSKPPGLLIWKYHLELNLSVTSVVIRRIPVFKCGAAKRNESHRHRDDYRPKWLVSINSFNHF